MMSLWGIDAYLNYDQIQIGDTEIVTAAYGSFGSFGSIVRSKYIGRNTYTSRRSSFRSKPIPIHGPVHNSDLNY